MTRRALCLVLALHLLGAAAGHATLVLGEVTVTPDPPVAGVPFSIAVTLSDPSLSPVEDAVVAIELSVYRPEAAALPSASTEAPDQDALVVRYLGESAPARYEAEVVLDAATTYHLLIRDRTFEWEEANASLLLEVGGPAVGTLPFVLPPTAIGPRSLWTWLLWLVGLPIVAGLVVTVLVLTSRRAAETAPPP